MVLVTCSVSLYIVVGYKLKVSHVLDFFLHGSNDFGQFMITDQKFRVR